MSNLLYCILSHCRVCTGQGSILPEMRRLGLDLLSIVIGWDERSLAIQQASGGTANGNEPAAASGAAAAGGGHITGKRDADCWARRRERNDAQPICYFHTGQEHVIPEMRASYITTTTTPFWCCRCETWS